MSALQKNDESSSIPEEKARDAHIPPESSSRPFSYGRSHVRQALIVAVIVLILIALVHYMW